MKRSIAIILVMLMMLSMTVMGETQEIISYEDTDIYDHWAYDVMSKWISKGFITGYPDGTYRPDGKISKAEFITLINRVFGYNEISDENYNDVTTNDWFNNQTLIAKKNRYMNWYSDDSLIPNNKITRQEVSAILVHITNIKETEGFAGIQDYDDKETIPEWSTAYIDAVVNKGYMTGYSDNTLRPNGEITRAEAVTMLDRVVGVLIDEEGTYGPSDEINTIYNNITITAKDVVLQNTVIRGDLILAAGIKDGEVNLNNVTVEGQTIVNGGGENSITFTNCNVGDIIVYKVSGKVRVVSKDSTIGKAILESSSKLKGSFKDVSIKVLGAGDTIELEGSYDEIVLESKVQVEVSNSSKIDVLEVTETGSGSEIDLKTAAEVKTLRFKGAADVKGKGKIVKAVVEADGATTEQRVTRKIVKSGVDGSDVKVVVIPTSSTPPSPSDTTAPEVGNGGTITTSKVLSTSITLSWTKGTDDKTSQENLEYLAYYSISNNIDTVENIESNGTTVGSYTSNIDTVDVTGLSEDTTYYFNVIVKDEAGNKSAYTMVSGKTTIIVPDGSVEKPFRITHIEDLASIGRTDLKADWSLDKNYILTKDLDFDLDASYKNPSDTSFGDINEDGNVDGIKIELTKDGEKGWEPIGTVYTNPFIGSFDGNNYKISNLYINRDSSDSYIGLFGYSGSTDIYGFDDGVIKNLGLENVDIIGYENVGTIAGVNREGSIINCYSTGNVTAIDNDAGGIVGYNSKGKIENCYSNANITADDSAGGIAGSQNQNGVIKECFSTGKVIATDSGAGGIAGGVSRGSIINSFSTGEIVSNGNSAGGIVGSNHYGAITNCYSIGNIRADNEYAGGIVGYTFDSSISSCYSIAIITASNKHAGGIAGFINQGGIQSCIAFNNQVIAGIEYASRIISESEGSTYLTENYANSSMLITINGSSTTVSSVDSLSMEGSDVDAGKFKNEYNYNKDGFVSGWDFTTWEIKSGADRPTLQGVGDDDGLISDTTVPTPGDDGSITATAIGTESVTLNWEKGSDNKTAQSNLEYLAYYSTSNNLDTVENIEVNGTAVGSYTSDIDTVDVTGLSENTIYYFNIIVKDQAGNKNMYTTLSDKTLIDVGSGTVEDPFKLFKIEDLAKIGTENWGLDKHYVLMNDLDFEDTNSYKSGEVNTSYTTGEGWIPIGNGNNFTGTFDGNNNKIKNLYIDRFANYQALFGRSYNATIQNVSFVDADINGNLHSGVLVGKGSLGAINNCSSNGTVLGGSYVGGLVGESEYITFANCYSKVNAFGNSYIGGLVGKLTGGKIHNSYSSGNATANAGGAGGLAGASSGEIKNCYSSGNVTANGTGNAGGITALSSGTVENCYSMGNITSSYDTGGIAAWNSPGTIRNCIAFNSQIIGKDKVRRISSYMGDVTQEGNYANSNMIVIDNGVILNVSADGGSRDGFDISSLTQVESEPLLSWDFDDKDVNEDKIYWKLETGKDRPVLFVDPDGDGTFEKLGDDDGLIEVTP